MGSDTGHQALWDRARKKYVAYGRFGAGGRKIARAESDDFVHWSPPRRVFAADAHDGRGVQFYGMGISLYEGIYVGLPWIFREGTTNRIDVQLATSRDGIEWKRAGNRQTFIPNGKKGGWDGGCIFTASQPIQLVGDTIFIFYSALTLDHEEPRPSRKTRPEYGESSIGVATLRRDGFVSLDAGENQGMLRTKPFQLTGDHLFVNADARGGELHVELLNSNGGVVAQSKQLTGNLPRERVRWNQGDFTPWKDQMVSLRFALRGTKVYSYWFR